MTYENEVIGIVLKNCRKSKSNPQPANKLTIQQLANELGVTKNDLLSQVKKCHQAFQKWSATRGKGTWDFEIENLGSQGNTLKFQKITN